MSNAQAGSSSVAAITYPDFYACDARYGENMGTTACLAAASQLPRGENLETWQVNTPGAPFVIPLTDDIGACFVSIELAGPANVRTITAVPNQLWEVATFVIQKCVTEQGVGGFATQGIEAMLAVTGNPRTDPVNPYPSSSAFLTVTVYGPTYKLYAPGNTDPYIPIVIAGLLDFKRKALPRGSSSRLKDLYSTLTKYWITVAALMERGGSEIWWETKATEATSEMTYKCDIGLGSPSYPKCSRLVYELPYGSVTLVPGDVRFFSWDDCYLALSAATIIVINWSQIRTALETLLNLCVGPPLQDPAGGRAFYGPMLQSYNRRKKKRSELTGLNALPPHVNLTVFEQREPWTSAVGELNSCTWKAVSNGSAVKTCKVS